jgi:hypothetical protein
VNQITFFRGGVHGLREEISLWEMSSLAHLENRRIPCSLADPYTFSVEPK